MDVDVDWFLDVDLFCYMGFFVNYEQRHCKKQSKYLKFKKKKNFRGRIKLSLKVFLLYLSRVHRRNFNFRSG